MHRKTLCSLIVLFIGFLQHVNSSIIPTSMNSSLSGTGTFAGSISSNTPTFTRPDTYSNSYYYQIIEVTVYTSGTYSFTSDSSSTSLVGCLYQTYFDPSHPSSGGSLYFGCNDGSAMGGKFSILNQYLYSGTRYLLVVTTSQAYSTTSYYTVTSSGVGSTYASMTRYTPQSITRTGSLWSSNPEFNRPGSSSSSYYDTYDVTISSTGTYSFESTNVYSFDPYACLYQTSFNPSVPSLNKLACDDDGAGNLQFLITQNLDSYTRYILVVTTSSSYRTGSYSFTVTGPSYPTLSLTTTTSQIIILIGPIVGGVIGFVVFVIILIVLIRVCQFRRTRPIIRQTIIQPQYNPTPSVAIYPIVHQTPYGNPPPYNAYMTNK